MNKDTKNVDFENLTDEEIDEFYRPQKSNSRKSLAPLYVYLILVNHSGPDRHLTQNEITSRLSSDYEIELERKALSRIIHTLSGEGIGICNAAKSGAWYDPNL